MTEIQKRIFELKDEKYCDFQSDLIPSVDKERFIGVRTPDLKALAKKLYGTDEVKRFLDTLPHEYFDEDQLHAFLICEEKNFDTCLKQVKQFLPYINNWATCDQLSPRCFYKRADGLLDDVWEWIKSGEEYTVRFGVGCLMRYFLDERFKPEYAKAVSLIRSDKYYINMMISWYFATALAKQYDSVIGYLTQRRLDTWVHNKAIQKAIESRRIDEDTKAFLRSLKI